MEGYINNIGILIRKVYKIEGWHTNVVGLVLPNGQKLITLVKPMKKVSTI